MSLQALGKESDREADYEIAIMILIMLIEGAFVGDITKLGFFASYGMITTFFSILALFAALTHA